MDRMALTDEDLFTDLKLGSEKKIYNLYAANMANIVHEEHVFANLNKTHHDNYTVHDGQQPFATLNRS